MSGARVFKLVAISVVIFLLLLVIFFFPKKSGGGGSGLGVKNVSCKCFGSEKVRVDIGPWRATCYGIPHSCESWITK